MYSMTKFEYFVNYVSFTVSCEGVELLSAPLHRVDVRQVRIHPREIQVGQIRIHPREIQVGPIRIHSREIQVGHLKN